MRYPLKITIPQNCFFLKPNAKILILRQDRIGDLLITTPLIRLLRQHLPKTISLDILLSIYNYKAKAATNGTVSNAILLPKTPLGFLKTLAKLRRTHYDIIIDPFEVASRTSSIIIKTAKPTFAIGLDKENRHNYDYTVPLLDRFNTSIVERTAQVLLPFGIAPKAAELTLSYGATPKAPPNPKGQLTKLGINLAGNSQNRQLNPVAVLALIEKAQQQWPACQVEVFAQGQLLTLAGNIKGARQAIITKAYHSFEDYANALSQCSAVVTPDTAAVHLCAAFGVPVVAVYVVQKNAPHGPWYPVGVPYKAIEKTDTTANASGNELFNALKEIIDKR